MVDFAALVHPTLVQPTLEALSRLKRRCCAREAIPHRQPFWTLRWGFDQDEIDLRSIEGAHPGIKPLGIGLRLLWQGQALDPWGKAICRLTAPEDRHPFALGQRQAEAPLDLGGRQEL
ncbi:MAG: hypothetical protein N2690_12290 [Rhodocyclaceae bacterium]|nr:hypothetical protein [Rhodocyclaceae bacterium]